MYVFKLPCTKQAYMGYRVLIGSVLRISLKLSTPTNLALVCVEKICIIFAEDIRSVKFNTVYCHQTGQQYKYSVHPCEKVIGIFFQNQIWSRLLYINRLCLVCIKRSIEEVKMCQISKRGYQQGPRDETLKNVRCQFCDDKFGHRIMEAVGFFDYKMRNFTQTTLNFTNRWSKGVDSWFSDNILHKWYFRKLYTIK